MDIIFRFRTLKTVGVFWALETELSQRRGGKFVECFNLSGKIFYHADSKYGVREPFVALGLTNPCIKGGQKLFFGA